MTTLKLEHGKKYRDRMGQVHEITKLEQCDWSDEGYTHERSSGGLMYAEDGKCFPMDKEEHLYDLVEEVK